MRKQNKDTHLATLRDKLGATLSDEDLDKIWPTIDSYVSLIYDGAFRSGMAHASRPKGTPTDVVL